jgi:hypothetical protein
MNDPLLTGRASRTQSAILLAKQKIIRLARNARANNRVLHGTMLVSGNLVLKRARAPPIALIGIGSVGKEG